MITKGVILGDIIKSEEHQNECFLSVPKILESILKEINELCEISFQVYRFDQFQIFTRPEELKIITDLFKCKLNYYKLSAFMKSEICEIDLLSENVGECWSDDLVKFGREFDRQNQLRKT